MIFFTKEKETVGSYVPCGPAYCDGLGLNFFEPGLAEIIGLTGLILGLPRHSSDIQCKFETRRNLVINIKISNSLF